MRSTYVRLVWKPSTLLRRYVLKVWLRSVHRSLAVYANEAKVVPQRWLPPRRRSLRCVVVSDTHAMQGDLSLPAGDVLIHAGDLLRRDATRNDGRAELRKIGEWFARQKFSEKLVIAGNHDRTLELLDRRDAEAILAARYCDDDVVEIRGFRFFLSPFSAANDARSVNRAFQSEERRHKFNDAWAQAQDVDVLVTHGPPKGVLDAGVGSLDVARAARTLRPRVHVFGHQHNAFGVASKHGTLFINAANADGLFALTRPPVVFDLTTTTKGALCGDANFVRRIDVDSLTAEPIVDERRPLND